MGFHDFCGSGVVHLVGGTAAIWGTYVCGPRLGKFGNMSINRASTTTTTIAEERLRIKGIAPQNSRKETSGRTKYQE